MWYDKFLGIPYKHLGSDKDEGLDCYNLCKLAYEDYTNTTLPTFSYDVCNIVDVDWYNKTTVDFFSSSIQKDTRWRLVEDIKPLDFVLMSIGSTNVNNHCALYLGSKKILQTFINSPSYVTLYGSYYQQYTTGIYRWTSTN